jgi:hypothetical protein
VPDDTLRLPNADLVVYPDAGHGGIFQFHDQFVTKALAFLDEIFTVDDELRQGMHSH